MGVIDRSHLVRKVAPVALLALPVVLAGCSAASPTIPVRTDWPADLVGDMIDEPSFGSSPEAVYDCGNYITVTYDGVCADEIGSYIDALEERDDLFVVYDERGPVVSCSFVDRSGNQVEVSQMDEMGGAGHSRASVTVIKA